MNRKEVKARVADAKAADAQRTEIARIYRVLAKGMQSKGLKAPTFDGTTEQLRAMLDAQ